jgi:hypothetical protein
MPSAYRSIDPRQQRLVARQRFLRARAAQDLYARQLKGVARQIDLLVKGLAPQGDINLRDIPAMRDILRRYSETLRPWATSVTARMHAEISQRDLKAWTDLGRTIGREIRKQVEEAVPGMELRNAMEQQVELITTLPLNAAKRVHEYAQKLYARSGRADELKAEILRTGKVSAGEAKRIAFTQVSRTSSLLTETRAKHIGSPGYFWRTAKDRDVRPMHKALEGKFIEWGNPPIAGSNGARAHAGQIYFCFPGDTLLRPPQDLLKVFRAFYSGDLVIVETTNSSFEATPNHPILTPFGWVPVCLLEQGDDLLHLSLQGCDAVENDIDEGLVTFTHLYESLSSYGETQFSSEFDLYGDSLEGEIEVVSPIVNLPSDLNPGSLDSFSEDMISSSDMGVSSIGEKRSGSQVLQANASGLRYQSNSSNSVSVSHPNIHTLTETASYYPVPSQEFSDSHRSSSVVSSKRFTADSRLVSFDDFIDRQVIPISGSSRVQRVGRRNFSGHVFSLETVKGYYSIGETSIISKNCRCYPEPVIPDVL